MRAREPDEQGYVERDGVEIGLRDLRLRGTATATPRSCSRRSTRSSTTGSGRGRSRTCPGTTAWSPSTRAGNGRSDRPHRPGGRTATCDFVADTIAVMDAARRGPGRAGGHLLERLAVAAGRRAAPRPGARAWSRRAVATTTRRRSPFRSGRRGALRRGAATVRGLDQGQPALLAGATGRSSPSSSSTSCCREPHSTKQLGGRRRVDAARRRRGAARAPGRAPGTPETGRAAEAMLRSITCPVLIIHGTDDRCQPLGRARDGRRADRRRAAGPGGLRAPADGPPPGHGQPGASRASSTGSPARPPPRAPDAAVRSAGRARSTSPRRSGSATSAATWRSPTRCASSDRTSRSQWLTQSPVAEFLEQRGELVHPASRLLASESGHFESESGEHDLHAFQAVRRMDEVLVNNFMVFDDLVEREAFDVWLGRRGLGPRPLPAREPRAQAGAVRLDDRLRRLGADARRRRARGVADLRLQRRDGRARGALPRAARPVGVRRRPGRRRRPAARARTCRRPGSGPRRTSTSPGT